MDSKSIPHGSFSFLKLLKDDDFSREIRIPHSFVKKHRGKLSSKYHLVNAEENISWTVKIRRKGQETQRYFMCGGDWSDFVSFYDLEHGDYLLFVLVDQKTFKVIPYGADCCRKMPVSDEFDLSSNGSSDDNDDDDYSSSDEHSEEDDGVIKNLSVYSRVSTMQKRNQPNKIHKVESGAGPSKRSQHFKKAAVDLSIPGPSNKSKTLKTVRKSARRISNAKDLFCIVTIKNHNKKYMTIPRPFARMTKIEEKETVILRCKDERKWEVRILHNNGRVNMGKGWPDFYKGYSLKEGDTCKFTNLKFSGNELLVEITRKIA